MKAKKRILLDDLEANHCRFPNGEKAPYTFCGKQKKKGSSFCPDHHSICYTGVTSRGYYLFASSEKKAA